MAATRSSARRPTLKIRSGDRVEVISGKDRGKSGRVLRVEPAKARLYVEGLNMVKRHMRPQQVRDTRSQAVGGVIDREGPIHISNVKLIERETKAEKKTRKEKKQPKKQKEVEKKAA